MSADDRVAPLEVASLADVWRNPDDPRWKAAHDGVRRVFFREARRHPRLKRVPRSQLDDELEDLLAGFWCHLTDNRAALEARRVRGSGAMRIEIWRFLDRNRDYPGDSVDGGSGSDGDPGEPRRKLMSHLRNNKVVPTLRGDPRFWRRGGRGPWLLACWAEQPPDDLRTPLPDEVAAALPFLSSRLEPQKPGQLPPLVHDESMPPFLEQALSLSRRPRRDWDLAKLAWARLRPSPDTLFLLAPVPDDDDEDQAFGGQHGEAAHGLDRERWARRVDLVASALADRLTPRQQRVVLGHCRRVPHETIATDLEISRGTLHNEIKRFREDFAGVAENEHLDEADARLLLEVLLNILEAEAFSPPQREPS